MSGWVFGLGSGMVGSGLGSVPGWGIGLGSGLIGFGSVGLFGPTPGCPGRGGKTCFTVKMNGLFSKVSIVLLLNLLLQAQALEGRIDMLQVVGIIKDPF